MTLRLTPEDDAALQTLADAIGVSKHEAASRAIREAAERFHHSDLVSAASARGRARYAELLDRLGK